MVRSIFLAENPASGSLIPSTTAADYIEIPLRNENVRPSSTSTQSELIREDRQPQDTVRNGFTVQGSLNSEFMWGAFDTLLEAVLFSADWATVNGGSASGALDVVASTKTITLTGAFSSASVGDWVRLENTGEANDGIVGRIKTVTDADNAVLDSLTSELSDETATAGYTLRFGERIVGGNTRRDFAYVKKLSDASGDLIYEALLGILLSGWTLQAQPNSILTTTFDFRGRKVVPDFDGDFNVNSDGEIDAAGTNVDLATYLASGFTSAPSNDVFNSIKHATLILDKTLSTLMTDFQLQIQNNIEGEGVIGQQGDRIVEPGNMGLSGRLEAIIDDTALYEKFLNDQVASAAVYLNDSADQGYVLDLPSVRLNDGGTSIPGQTGSIKLPLAWGGKVDSTTSRAIQIIRFDPTA